MANYKHGGYGTRLYNRWVSMKKRCNNSANPSYSRYGGRGIGYHSDFEEYMPFRDYLISVGWEEDTDLQIDRIDNNGDYTYGNLRLVDVKENRRNQEARNASGYLGVYYRKATGKYKAELKRDGKSAYLGYFDTAEEAAKAVEEYRNKEQDM